MTRRISALKRNALAVIVYPRIWKARWRIAAQLGFTVDDFMWISSSSKWWRHIYGINRSMLVLDPFDVVYGAPDHDLFAAAIQSSFDRIVNPTVCVPRLAEWLKTRNPPAYARMMQNLGERNERTAPHDIEQGTSLPSP